MVYHVNDKQKLPPHSIQEQASMCQQAPTPTCLEARGSEGGVVQQPREVLGVLRVRVFLDLPRVQERKNKAHDEMKIVKLSHGS